MLTVSLSPLVTEVIYVIKIMEYKKLSAKKVLFNPLITLQIYREFDGDAH